ncbi:MMPL family transporter [Mycobacterium sp.]|jgi:putative drug exporter of the RND superfamily|uniref:MMPL family transporter n=1 Tax=Mycobacterium sp. TaxID=1785 RepID=UPI00260111FE|nr:MMPL family transporter [Mycobacterium sp.]
MRRRDGAELNTGLIRPATMSGRLVTTAGIVFAVAVTAMVSCGLTSVGMFGSIAGIGLRLDTLIVRSLINPALARLLGPFFGLPRIVLSAPRESASAHWPPSNTMERICTEKCCERVAYRRPHIR